MYDALNPTQGHTYQNPLTFYTSSECFTLIGVGEKYQLWKSTDQVDVAVWSGLKKYSFCNPSLTP